jgi:hypothetical protein
MYQLLLVRRIVKFKGSSLVLLPPSARCKDHHELDQKPRAAIAFFLKFGLPVRITCTIHAPGENEVRSLVKSKTEFTKKGYSTSSNCVTTHSRCVHTRNRKCNVGAICALLTRTPRASFKLKCSI